MTVELQRRGVSLFQPAQAWAGEGPVVDFSEAMLRNKKANKPCYIYYPRQFSHYWHFPAGAQAVIAEFSDGTGVHIGIEPAPKVALKVDAEMEKSESGDVSMTKVTGP